jgi:retinol dehydrogenase-13
MSRERRSSGASWVDADLSGRVAVVTGANRGMGKETARELARLGCTVILGCRNQGRGEAAADEINKATRGTAIPLELDLSSLASVRSFVTAFNQRFSTLDVLVNNAAASLGTREVTADGFEVHWATNVLGPHLLTQLLLPALQASGHGRVVSVSTLAAGGLDLSDTQYERRRFSGLGSYRASKQAVQMLTFALAERLDPQHITANSLNPGYVLTELTTNVGGLLKALIVLTSFRAVSEAEGADTAIWLAASPAVDGVSGRFWNKRREARIKFCDPQEIEQLWALVERQLISTGAEPLAAP